MNSKLKILFFCIWSVSCFAMQEETDHMRQQDFESFLHSIALQEYRGNHVSEEIFEEFFELLESSNIDPLVFSKRKPNLSIFALAIEYKQERCAIAMLNAILKHDALNAILRKNHKRIISKNKDSGIYLGLSPRILALVVENNLFELAEILSVHFTNSELKTLWFCIEKHLQGNPYAFRNWKNLIKKILMDRILTQGSIEELKTIVLNIFDFAILHESFDIIALFADRDILKFLLEINRDLITKLLIKQKFEVLKILRTQNPDLYELKDAYNNTTLLHLAQSCLDANEIQINTIRKAFNFLISQKIDLNAKNCYGKNVLDILTDIQGGSDNLRALIDIFLRLGIKTSSVLGSRNRQESKIDKTEFTHIFESGNLEEIEQFIKTRSDEILPSSWLSLLTYPISENIKIIRRWFVENKIHLNYRISPLKYNILEVALFNNDWDFADFLISNEPSLFEKCNFDLLLNQFMPLKERAFDPHPIILLCKGISNHNISKLFSRFIVAPDKRLIESLKKLNVDFSFKGDFGRNTLEEHLGFIIHDRSIMHNGHIMRNIYYTVRNGLTIENKYILANQNYIKIYNKFKRYTELAEQFRAFLIAHNGKLLDDSLNLEDMYPATEMVNQEQANEIINIYKTFLAEFAKKFVELGDHIVIPACFINSCPLIKYLSMRKKLRLVILIENTIQEDFLKEILLSLLLSC